MDIDKEKVEKFFLKNVKQYEGHKIDLYLIGQLLEIIFEETDLNI